MSIKQQLAELYSGKDLPLEQFKQLPAFSSLETEIDVIEKIQKYRLPEVTRLICASTILLEQEWAKRYQGISAYCCSIDDMDSADVFRKYTDVGKFVECVLSVEYGPVINKLQTYVEELRVKKQKCSNEKKRLQNKLKSLQKSAPPTTSDNSLQEGQEDPVKAEEEELQENIQKIQKKIEVANKYFKYYKKHFEKISEYLERCSDKERENNARDQAYSALNELRLSFEEDLLLEFVRSGEVSDQMRLCLREKTFCSRLLQCLEKNSLQNYAFPVLVQLYEDGAIDLESDDFMYYIENHPRLLCEYLVDKVSDSSSALDSIEESLLVETAIRMQLNSAHRDLFSDLWNTFVSEESWMWLFRKIQELEPDNTVNAVSRIMSGVKGKASVSAMQVLYQARVPEMSISPLEVCDTLLENNDNSDKDVVMGLLRLLETNNRRIQRKLNTAERQLRSHGQDLFSALYIPVEQLEELTTNLKCSEGSIKCDLVGSQMTNIVVELREGLAALHLSMVEDVNVWSSQRPVDYDPLKHRMTLEGRRTDENVRLRTLGFEYVDDEGELKRHQAQVSPVDIEKNSNINKENGHSEEEKKSKNKKRPYKDKLVARRGISSHKQIKRKRNPKNRSGKSKE